MSGLKQQRPSRKIVILGAGPAGVTAAAAAAERGVGVTLVEASQRLGGSVTAAMHRCLCGLYADEPSSPLDTLNDSGQRRVISRMVHHAPDQVQPRRFGQAWVLEFPPAAWQAALADVCAHPLIDRRMGTRVAVRREGDRIAAIELAGDRPGWIDTPVLIDCTGGGQLLRLIGDDALLPPDPATPRMLAGYGVRVGGITGHLELLRLQIPYALTKAVQQDELPPLARFTVFHPGPGEGEGVLKLALDVARATSPCPAASVPGHGLVARATEKAVADSIFAALQRDVPGFTTARIIELSPHALPRDGDRLRGRAILSESDVLTAASCNTDAVRAWWPVERWDADQGPTYAYPPIGRAYEIAPDCLRSASITNLLAAGNAISATANAAASSRASGICLATGHLAGRLAAEL